MKHLLMIVFLVLAGLMTDLQTCFPARTDGAAEKGPLNRVVSLGPLITDMIYQLGADDRLAGVTSFCNIPAGKENKPVIGTVIQINVEEIVRLQPDAVFASTLTRVKQIQALKGQGIRVIRFDNPTGFETLCAMFMDLGTLMGKQRAAQEMIRTAAAKVDLIRKTAETLTRRSVFIQIGIKPLKTAEQGTFISSYIELAGGRNIAGHTGSGIFSREYVLQQNPEVIFVATMGTSTKAGHAEKAAWMKFSALTAVKNNEIHVLARDSVFSPTPLTFADTLMLFFSHIHPSAAQTLMPGGRPSDVRAQPRGGGS
jgi:iron complex transport system substrate-binding protein